MMNKHFLRGIPALLMVFVLVFTACEGFLTEEEGTVDLPSQQAPNVTYQVVKGGVVLEWDAIADMNVQYEVWRKAPDVAPVRIGSISSSSSSGIGETPSVSHNSKFELVQETGKYRYIDLVSKGNHLEHDTTYTYTVLASGGMKNAGRKEVTVKLEIPDRGRLDEVTDIKLELDTDNEEIRVSWKIPEKATPAYYSVMVYRDNISPVYYSPGSTFWSENISFNWPVSMQSSGEYTVVVEAVISEYFQNNRCVSPDGNVFVNLFEGAENFSMLSPQSLIEPNTNTLTGFAAEIELELGSNKSNSAITYTVWRAELDDTDSEITEYTKIDVYPDTTSGTPLSETDLTVKASTSLAQRKTVYDKSLPKTGGRYGYQIRATREGVAPQKRTSRPLSINPRQFANLSIVIGAPSGNNPKKYAVTSSALKGTLQDGDRLAFYYFLSKEEYDFYDNLSISSYSRADIDFTKDQLEASSAASLELEIPKETDNNFAHVQVYLLFADGTWESVTEHVSGAGLKAKSTSNPASFAGIGLAELNNT
jgi:hypothetical protein